MAETRHLAIERNFIMPSKVGDHDEYQLKDLIETIIKNIFTHF